MDPARLADEIPGLLRYARSIVRDAASAEDLVQDTLTRAWEKRDTFRGESSLSTWLHRILHNLAVDRMRRTREDPSEDVAALVEAKWRDETYTVDPAAVAARTDTVEEVRDALLRLPFIYRTAVVLHDMQELTVPEIARIQHVSLAAAKQRLRRGRMMLVTALARGAERRVARRGVPLSCWEARSLVSDYLDQQLPDGDRQLLEGHLARCPTCPPPLRLAGHHARRTGPAARLRCGRPPGPGRAHHRPRSPLTHPYRQGSWRRSRPTSPTALRSERRNVRTNTCLTSGATTNLHEQPT